MSFDPRTAYADDWQYLDGIQDATLLVRRENAEVEASYPVKLLRANSDSPDYQRFGLAARFSPGDNVWYFWQTSADHPWPQIDDAIEMVDEDGEPVHWLITGVQESRIGPYTVSAVKGRVNVYSA